MRRRETKSEICQSSNPVFLQVAPLPRVLHIILSRFFKPDQLLVRNGRLTLAGDRGSDFSEERSCPLNGGSGSYHGILSDHGAIHDMAPMPTNTRSWIVAVQHHIVRSCRCR